MIFIDSAHCDSCGARWWSEREARKITLEELQTHLDLHGPFGTGAAVSRETEPEADR